MSTEKKVSVALSAERLEIHLSGIGPARRVLLISGLNNVLKGIKVPSELIHKMVGSMFGYTNLELTTPAGETFLAVETLGSADAGWRVVAGAAMAAGYAIADVQDRHVLLSGHEDQPIPLAACTGRLHSVYADTV